MSDGRMMLVVEPAGKARLVPLPVTQDEINAALKQAVGGWLEGVTGREWVAYCDEDGKGKGLPANEAATILAVKFGWRTRGDFLVGPVVFVGNDGSPDECSVPQELIDAVRGWGLL
jgi:hypothetical protein